MDLASYLRIFRKGWLVIVAVTLAVLSVAVLWTLLTPRMYTGKASVFFSVEGANSVGELASGSTYAERQVKSYSQVAQSPKVLDPVIKKLGLKTTAAALGSKTNVMVPAGTVIIEISVQDRESEQAAMIANAISDQLSTAVSELSPKNAKGEATASATVIRPAVANSAATSPKLVNNIFFGLLLGLMLGSAIIFLREILDTRVRSGSDIRAVTDNPVLGELPQVKSGESAMIDADSQQTPLAEAYRRLRTNLSFLTVDQRPSSYVVTSSVPNEGKSTVSINLANTIAEADQKVLLIEADLRRPVMSKYLGLISDAGLTTVLIGQASLDDVVQPVGDGGLHVLSSGSVPPNPSELLGSDKMRAVLDEATQKYDVVIADCPPLLPVTDAAVLAGLVGGALVVVGNKLVGRPELETALQSLQDVDASHIALIHNLVPVAHSPYRYDYQYQSEQDHNADSWWHKLVNKFRASSQSSPDSRVATEMLTATSDSRDASTKGMLSFEDQSDDHSATMLQSQCEVELSAKAESQLEAEPQPDIEPVVKRPVKVKTRAKTRTR